METWLLFILTALVASLLLSLLLTTTKNLPPGPFTVPIIGNFLWLNKSLSELEPILRKLKAKYGPIITLRIGSAPTIIITNRSLAHQALIQNGAVFADRPPAPPTAKITSSNQHSVSSAAYGPTWRLLRRNLTAEILHPSRVKAYGGARKWVLDILADRLISQPEDSESSGIKVVDHFQYAMFCLLVLMCFGDKHDENQIKEILRVQRNLLLGKFNILNFKPKLTRIFLRKRWERFSQLRKEQEQVLLPLIRARKVAEKVTTSYVDTLWSLQLPDEKRNLTEHEIISLCSEFLDGGTDTTSTALQWIMANVVKYPSIEEKLFSEIKGVVEENAEEVKEDDLQKMPYLKAVILEGLRRHPPAHFVLPHAVTSDVVLGGHVVPKNGTVNFMVVEIGLDPEVWEEPMEFKPERFLSKSGEEVFDITGSREIKMMPFGVGRRICPGWNLAVLHLEYFVANLVWKFEWRGVEGHDVDFSEKQEFTIVMKNPLRAHLSPRAKK